MSRPSDDDINDRIDAWHNSPGDQPIYLALGWTEAEYAAWVSDPNIVPERPLPDTFRYPPRRRPSRD